MLWACGAEREGNAPLWHKCRFPEDRFPEDKEGLAKSLASLDHLLGGRLIAGLGSGWSPDEFEAVGPRPFDERGAALDEFLDVAEVGVDHVFLTATVATRTVSELLRRSAGL